MSEDCHSSGQDMTPEDFERWKIEAQGEMLKAAKELDFERAAILRDKMLKA